MDVKIAVATISMARNDAEADELISSLKALTQSGLAIFIADRSSHAGFQHFLEGADLKVLRGAQDLIAQARFAIEAAANAAQAVLYTEPDKQFFFTNRLQTFIEGYSNAELRVPSRSRETFQTYSKIQQQVETAINLFSSRLLNVTGDFTYGPILFPSKLAKILDNIPAHLGWGWRPYLMRMAAREKIPIALREVDLPCPENQRADTEAEWLHRMRQFNQNLMGLMHDGRADEFAAARDLFPTFSDARH